MKLPSVPLIAVISLLFWIAGVAQASGTGLLRYSAAGSRAAYRSGSRLHVADLVQALGKSAP
jgi:hypothetical protein